MPRLHARPRTLAALLIAAALAPGAAHGLFEGGCIALGNGGGTIDLPPQGCDYLAPNGFFEILGGLPPGDAIDLAPRETEFVCVNTPCGQPGGSLGGEFELYDSTLVLQLAGSGTLADFRRTIRLPISVETHSAPRTPGDPVQSFETDLFTLQGTLPPDNDFAELTIVAGTGNGFPSPGHSVLEDRLDGSFNVDSFFDVQYRIDFVGAPGGRLDGLSGPTQGVVRIETFAGKQDAVEPDLRDGTIELPPAGAKYVNPLASFVITDGLPPGDTIELDPTLRFPLCNQGGQLCGLPGGGLGGEVEDFSWTMELVVTGTGSLAGFTRTIGLSPAVTTFSGPRTPSDPVQPFDTDLFAFQAGIFGGDPDFAELQIVAGAVDFFPSPGHTTLTDQADGTFLVDSFFDVHYLIEFIGAPGGQLEGLAGTNEGALRLTACDDFECPTVVDVPSQTFALDESILSAGIARSSGDLDVQAEVEIIARHVVSLGNGFSAMVAPTEKLILGTDDVVCPIPP